MRFGLLLIAVLLLAPSVPAQSLADQLGDSPTMEELQALYQRHYDKWVEDIQSQQGLESPHWPEFPAVSFYPFFEKAARAGEKDAMDWVLMNYGNVQRPPKEVLELKMLCIKGLMDSDPGSEHFLTVINTLTYEWDPRSYVPWKTGSEILSKLYQRIDEKDAELRARALYAMYSVHDRREDDDGAKTAIQILERLNKEFSATRVGSMAKGLLFDKRHLQVGMKAPNFVGKDVDGNPIQLRDFKGKVTYLVFWGFW